MDSIFKRHKRALLRSLQKEVILVKEESYDISETSPSIGGSTLPTGTEAIIKSTFSKLVTKVKTSMPQVVKKRVVDSLFATHHRALLQSLQSAITGKKKNTNSSKLPRCSETIIVSTFEKLFEQLKKLISDNCADKDKANNNLLCTQQKATKSEKTTLELNIKHEEQVLVKQAGFKEKFGPLTRKCRAIKNPCRSKECYEDLWRNSRIVHFARSHLGLDPYQCAFDRRRCTFSAKLRRTVLKHIEDKHLAKSGDSNVKPLQYLQLIPLSELKDQ